VLLVIEPAGGPQLAAHYFERAILGCCLTTVEEIAMQHESRILRRGWHTPIPDTQAASCGSWQGSLRRPDGQTAWQAWLQSPCRPNPGCTSIPLPPLAINARDRIKPAPCPKVSYPPDCDLVSSRWLSKLRFLEAAAVHEAVILLGPRVGLGEALVRLYGRQRVGAEVEQPACCRAGACSDLENCSVAA
jgi:hypothetical protein